MAASAFGFDAEVGANVTTYEVPVDDFGAEDGGEKMCDRVSVHGGRDAIMLRVFACDHPTKVSLSHTSPGR